MKSQKELQEKMKNLETDRDMLAQEKNILDENIKKYDAKLMDLEYQLKKR